MEERATIDVLICGAGAAGLTLAIDLARRGIAFRLIDQLDSPFAGSRGKGIQPRSQELLEDLGLLDRIVAIGGVYPPQREYRDDGSFVESPMMQTSPATAAEPYHIPLMVPQFLTERVLRERLAELGHAVEFGCTLAAFDQDEDGVTAQLDTAGGAQSVRALYLVGADGGRSFVRRALGMDFAGKTLGVRAMVADVHVDRLDRDAWHRWGEGDMARQISLCPLMGTDLFQLQAPVPLEGEVDLTADGLTRLLEDRTGRSDIVVRDVAWASAFLMNARLADRYRIRRIFLVGDAAHTHPPTGGQGLNTSMQDSYNLGWKLAAVLDGAPDALLDTYEQERRAIAAGMLGLATRLLDAARQGVMKRGRDVHQLDLVYPDSPLSFEAPARSEGLRAGDRAPDAPLTGAGGQPVRLFARLQGPHWMAIGYHVPRDAGPVARRGLHIHRIGPDGDLHDDAGHFAEAYGLAPGSWIVIRPDNYVGAIVDRDHVDSLDSYFKIVGLHPLDRNPLSP
jgi:2-polyprenyl-6-methoxyphenol hydroxylase-like FAD-dependent oxidoreductase